MRHRERRRLCRLCICGVIFALTLYSVISRLFGISLFHGLYRYPNSLTNIVYEFHDLLQQSLTQKHEHYLTLLRQATNTENRRFTRLHVLDAHHEVLPLWLRRFVEPTFSDLSESVLPVGRTILIHVDAHSDMAHPDLNAFLYPRKRFPLTIRELTALMQNNDQFIMPMAALNLFSDIIWIYPGWMDNLDLFHEVIFNVGIYRTASPPPSSESSTTSPDIGEQYMCVCAPNKDLESLNVKLADPKLGGLNSNSNGLNDSNTDSSHSSADELSCFYSSRDKDMDVLIPSVSCEVYGSTRLTIVKDLYVLSFMHLIHSMVKAGSFSNRNFDSTLSPTDSVAYKSALLRVLKILHPYASKSDIYQSSSTDNLRTTTPLPYILDIDEDFFGVQLPGWPLNQTGINVIQDVQSLNEELGSLFCSFDGATSEALFETCLRDLVDFFLSKWQCWEKGDKPQKECAHFESAYPLMTASIFSNSKAKLLLCSYTVTEEDSNVKSVFKKLWNFLRTKSRAQLQVIIRLRACMQRSASVSRLMQFVREKEKLIPDNSPFRLGLCLGNNEPGSKMVSEHVPTKEELKQQLGRLEAIFSDLRSPPALITLSRSLRDGYVPRSWQSQIESELLKLFTRIKFIRPDLSQDVSYDRDLWTSDSISKSDSLKKEVS